MKKQVFSGIQPTGNIHIGNYFGAMKQWVVSQAEFSNIFCIVDLHAITVPQDPQVLKVKIREVAGLLFAAGINWQESAVFLQSQVSAHDDSTKKMSKSEVKSAHAVNLLDSPDIIRSKIGRATTDSLREIRFDENRSGIYNLLVIYELFSGLARPDIERHFEGKGYADFKRELAEVVVEGLRPLQSRYHELTADPKYIDSLFIKGASKVRPTAERTLKKVKERVGLG